MSSSFAEADAGRTGFPLGPSLTAAIAVVGRQLEQINHWCLARRDLDRLMEFDDRALADIGLGRSEILHAVRFGRLPQHRNGRL